MGSAYSSYALEDEICYFYLKPVSGKNLLGVTTENQYHCCPWMLMFVMDNNLLAMVASIRKCILRTHERINTNKVWQQSNDETTTRPDNNRISFISVFPIILLSHGYCCNVVMYKSILNGFWRLAWLLCTTRVHSNNMLLAIVTLGGQDT